MSNDMVSADLAYEAYVATVRKGQPDDFEFWSHRGGHRDLPSDVRALAAELANVKAERDEFALRLARLTV